MHKFHSLQISALSPDADDAVALSIDVPEPLRAEFTGLPGQHIVLRLRSGEEELRRTYSLVSVPGEWPLRIVARVHEHGRMSGHLARETQIGDRIDVLAPNGSLTPPGQARDPRTYVGFASGCGITPVLAVARAVLMADAGHRFILFYGNTSSARTMLLEELLGLKDRYVDRLALHFVMSREPQEVELYNGRLDGERVRRLAPDFFKAADVAEFFVCGPGDMNESISGVLREWGVPPEHIHSEHFAMTAAVPLLASAAAAGPVLSAAAPSVRTASDAPTAGAHVLSAAAGGATVGADSAEVTILMDGRRRTFTMRMNDETVLDAAETAGLDLPYSCRAGVCSTCRTKVVRGEVEMAQNYALEDWELAQGYVLACQSRVKTAALELDYDEK